MPIKNFSYFQSHLVFVLTLIFLFLFQVLLQFDSARQVAVADSISYIIGGINLITEGHFTNSFGQPEVWFPPVYPILIGLLSEKLNLEPVFAARLISMAAGLLSVVVVYAICCRIWNNFCGFISAILLLSNPMFQFISGYALSEVLASSFALIAFYFWLSKTEKIVQKNLLVAFFLAAATLTRPEYVVFAISWPILEVIFSRKNKQKTMIGGLSCYVFFFILITPYALYLKDKTGVFTISNKSEVNVADGRSKYHQGPREIIDPSTFELAYKDYPNDTKTEIKRYFYNVESIWKSYNSIYTSVFVYIILGTLLFGLIKLLQEKQYKLVLGILSGFGYLSILALYSVHERYVYGTIPFISLLASYGFYSILVIKSNQSTRLVMTCKFLFVATVILALAEGYSRYPRWEFNRDRSNLEIIKDAGIKASSAVSENCVVYDIGATFGYYAGCRRGRLTMDRLELIKKYIGLDQKQDNAYLVFIKRKNKPIHSTLTLKQLTNDEQLSLVFQKSEKQMEIFLFKVF